jgi:hypothetical protein
MSRSGAFGSLRRTAVAVVLALLAAGGVWWGHGPVHAQAPAPQAQFGYLVLYSGWNLVSAADGGDLSFASGPGGLIQDTVYGLPPGATAYTTPPLNHLQTGAGYWVNHPDQNKAGLIFDTSATDSVTVHLPANGCTLLGNPSTKGSARVMGADSVYTFSPLLNNYVAQSLVGIGEGALACNGDHDSDVTIAYTGDVITAAWPSCCNPKPISNGGNAQLLFRNDSPSPITIAFRNMDDQGQADEQNPEGITGQVPGCNSCPEYTVDAHSSQGCSPSATTTQPFNVPPGNYHLEILSDDANVPELISDVAVSADTSYNLCYFIDANRPSKQLWPGS